MNLATENVLQGPDSLQLDTLRLNEAIQLSKKCIPVPNAFSVGALLYGPDGACLSTGYSRETTPRAHAEEVALEKAKDQSLVTQAGVMYSSLEPCGKRASCSMSCSDRIIAAGIRKVVFAYREPSLFVEPIGLLKLKEAGIEIVEIEELAEAVVQVNKHLLAR